MTYKDYCPNCAYGGCSAAEISAAEGRNSVKCPQFKILLKIDDITKERSMYFYKELPAGMRVATKEDLVPFDIPKLGLKFIIKSFYTGRFETKYLTENTNMDEIYIFLKEGHCFVKI